MNSEANSTKITKTCSEENNRSDLIKSSSINIHTNIWANFLEKIAWLAFGSTIVGGIYSAYSLVDSFGEDVLPLAIIIFIISTISAAIVLSVIMLFINMAKDISITAKNTAEIKKMMDS